MMLLSHEEDVLRGQAGQIYLNFVDFPGTMNYVFLAYTSPPKSEANPMPNFPKTIYREVTGTDPSNIERAGPH